jgi:hypothetical protein
MSYIRCNKKLIYKKDNKTNTKIGANNSNKENSMSNNKKNKALNFISNFNNKLFFKEYMPEEEQENDNSQNKLFSLKKEIFYKLTAYTQEDRTVKFSSGIEEIYDDNKSDDIDYKLFYNISNKKFSTPTKNTKSSYKKTKEHIKTPYKSTKSNSTRDKTKINKDKNNNISSKSSNYWKSILADENDTMNDSSSKDVEIDINRNCNSIILENPFANKKEYKILFCNISQDDNEEGLNKSF